MGYGRESEYRPGGEQFGERSASDQAFTVGNPVDLAGNIRALVDQERAIRGEDFNAAWWLRRNLTSFFYYALHRKEPEEKQLFFHDLRSAWDLVAYEQLDGENSNTIYIDLSGCADLSRNSNGRTSSVTLSPLGVTLLDAMAEALDIPDHTPGQATFDLSLFNTYGQIEKLRSNAPRLAPTKEEVKRAITPKQENIVYSDH